MPATPNGQKPDPKEQFRSDMQNLFGAGVRVWAPLLKFLSKDYPQVAPAAAILCSQLLFHTADEFENGGWVKKSMATIERETGLSPESQKTAQRVLQGAGLLEIERRRTIAYRVNLQRLEELFGKKIRRAAAVAVAQPCQPEPCTGTVRGSRGRFTRHSGSSDIPVVPESQHSGSSGKSKSGSSGKSLSGSPPVNDTRVFNKVNPKDSQSNSIDDSSSSSYGNGWESEEEEAPTLEQKEIAPTIKLLEALNTLGVFQEQQKEIMRSGWTEAQILAEIDDVKKSSAISPASVLVTRIRRQKPRTPVVPPEEDYRRYDNDPYVQEYNRRFQSIGQD